MIREGDEGTAALVGRVSYGLDRERQVVRTIRIRVIKGAHRSGKGYRLIAVLEGIDGDGSLFHGIGAVGDHYAIDIIAL